MMKKILLISGLALFLFYSCRQANDRPTAKQTKPEEIVLYNKYCKGCHGKEGDLEFSGASNLKTSVLEYEEVMAVIANGRGNMMPYNKVLTERHMQLLTEYVMDLRKINE